MFAVLPHYTHNGVVKNQTNTTKNVPVFTQVCKLIPPFLLRKTLTEALKDHVRVTIPRAFSYWSQIVSMIFYHLMRIESINELCDTLNHHRGLLNTLRNAIAPRRNTLSYANRTRSSEIIKRLFYGVLEHYQKYMPNFFLKPNRRFFRIPRRFKRTIRALDATTIELVANCMDWAKHRRKKAAAKIHMSLDVLTFTPSMVIVEPGNTHEANYMVGLCKGMNAGDIAIFDKAYISLVRLLTLTQKGIMWVTRCKEVAQFKVIKKLNKGSQKNIIRDELVEWKGQVSHKRYPEQLRRVEALVKDTEGNEVTVTFLTNNTEWAASSVCDLYRARWAIENFFKEIKQTLQLHTFIGYNRNSIEWQVWSAMLVYMLLRIQEWMHNWEGSFKRLIALIRGIAWVQQDLALILASYGTAKPPPLQEPIQTTPYLKGFVSLEP